VSSISSIEPHERSQQEKHELDIALARCALLGGQPFTFYDWQYHPETYDLFVNLLQDYTPPNRHRLAGELLDEVYEETERLVRLHLDESPRPGQQQ